MQIENPPTEKPHGKAEGEHRMFELANTVTEMTLVKHAFKSGIPAQRGIED